MKVEGPNGTVYDLPDEGEEVDLSVSAKAINISTRDGRAPIIEFSFEPATERLRGFTYSFYPWEVDWEAPE